MDLDSLLDWYPGMHENQGTLRTDAAINVATTKDFKQFDIVSDYSDHLFRDHRFDTSDRNILDKIFREWNILKKNLPESIYVRAYKGKINLLRVAIVGVSGTPYHDSLFFFDLAYPPNYPKGPPQVLLHPTVGHHEFDHLTNIMEQRGDICLCLLEPVPHNHVCEIWNPNQSTVLQVLISLQKLVQIKESYFMDMFQRPLQAEEARFFRQRKDLAFLSSCSRMLRLLPEPPKNFEGFVKAHFRERNVFILNACMAYREGRVYVGEYGEMGFLASDKIEVSECFEKEMDVLYPKLVKAFCRNGARDYRESLTKES